MRPLVTAYVGLGANLGDARTALQLAVQALQDLAGVDALDLSSLYSSAPIASSGPDYLNAVACLQTRLTAPALLAALQQIENAAGRERPYRNAPRTLDLDLLLYGSAQIASPTLTVPHPRMHQRAFVLLPLAELAPDLVRSEWLQAVADQQLCRLGALF